MTKKVANAQPTSIKSLTYTSSVVIGNVLAEFDVKNVQIDGCGGMVKQRILADNKSSKEKKIWCVKMLAWNEEARKFATQIPKGTHDFILNFLVKDQIRNDDNNYEGQSPYEIHFTVQTIFSTLG